jgi:hypothetical protein
MSKHRDIGHPIEIPQDTTPPEVGEDLGYIDEDALMTPQTFGTFAHQAYEWAAEEHFDDVESNRPVIVTKPDGTEAQGYIDTFIDERIVVDYKSNYMPGWSVSDARRYGDQHGQQVKEYVNSEGMPDDARGWIIATVPPESAEVRDAYADAASMHDVGVKFAAGEQQEDVIDVVSEAVAESAPPAIDSAAMDADTEGEA